MSGGTRTPVCGSSGCVPSRLSPCVRGWTRSRPTGTNNSGPSRPTSNESDHNDERAQRANHPAQGARSLIAARSEARTAMSEDRSVTSMVEVAVDPETAFLAFTEELDLWWVRGPINHHAGGRVLAMRCEPGPGGRLLEVYDDATGDALELARITAWEPGKRLAWTSSIDDVRTEVHFEQSDVGTVVRVVALVPADGQDRGGTSWVRVVPKWFGPWCARRASAPHEVRDLARLALGISYAKPAAAARWLAATFGFTSPDP